MHSEIKKALERINDSLKEVDRIKQSIKEFNELKEDDEFLAPIENGIFVKAKLISKELKVNIGKGVVVTKTIKDTLKLLDKQKKEITKSKIKLEKQIKNV